MRPEKLLSVLEVAGKLKKNTRHCVTDEGRKESVADHSWRMTLMAMLLENEPEFVDVDMDKVIRMCLIHDLGEAFTGDIPAFQKTDRDSKTEEGLYWEWVDTFPEEDRREWSCLLNEMSALRSKEAQVYKALDKLEAVISHNESDISTWLPLEYELQKTYGQENMKCSPYFVTFRKLVDEWTDRKISEEKKSN